MMIKNTILRTLGVRGWIAAALVPALFALEGCVKRTDFEQQSALEGSVEIALDWAQTATPTPLHFAFYRVDNGSLLYKEFEGTTEGFRGTLPVGEYNVIAYDKSAQKVGYRNMCSYATAEVYAQDASEGSKAATSTIAEPGAVHSVSECVDMATLTVTTDKTLKAKAQPQNRTRSVVLNFEIKNGSTVTTITGAMDGVSSSVLLSTGKSSNYAARLPFKVSSAADNSFQTTVSLFDFIAATAGAEQINMMDVKLIEAGGATHNIRLDLTQTIREIIQENGGVIPIEIPIEIKVDMTDVDGITAIVHPWDKAGDGGGEVIG
jgi:Domain of unknown function (DUF5119)